MEKKYARFVTLSNPGNYKRKMTLNDITIYEVEFDEITSENILKQTDEYFLSSFSSSFYENDVYGDVRRHEGFGGFEIRKLVSSFSSMYSTDAPRADILVSGKEFVGVVVYMRELHGSTWTSYTKDWFVIHYTDGSIIGVNRSEDAVYTEDTSKEDTKSYYLIKR